MAPHFRRPPEPLAEIHIFARPAGIRSDCDRWRASGPLQKSHVFSVDIIYDLVPKISLGAKYAFRKSEVAARSQLREFSASSAHLAIIRADWYVIHAWDITAEFRTLRGVDTKVTETDSLIAVYRHLGNNLKLGVGFQNGNLSDDITDIDYVGQGIFINLVAKF